MTDATKRPTFVAATEAVRDLAVEVVSYQPSDVERQLKAQFQAALEDNPVCDKDNVTAAAVAQLTNDSRIYKLWSKPGFRDWFCNRHEFIAKANYTLDLLLDSFRHIALDTNPKSYGAKVQAAKVLAEITGKVSKGVKTKVLDRDIPDDPEELEKFAADLETKTRRVK